jgi:glycosyltransferase involved in cell wall biosynthesis
MSTLSAIIPVYNEERTLQESFERLLKIEIISEFIIVNDCSTDSSEEIIEEIKTKNSNVKVFKNEENLGKGAALMKAQQHINTDYVVIHDADLEYFPEDLVSMFNLIENNEIDLVIGSRFIGDVKKIIYYRTYYANKLLSKAFSIIYNKEVTDIATCYKMMSSSYFKNIKLQEKGFSIEVELLAKYFKFNSEFMESPINYVARTYEEGKKIKVIDGFKYIWSMFKYRF